MAKIDLVLLDFDGTLVDTAPDIVRATNLFFESRGLQAISEAKIRAEIGMGLKQLILDVFPQKPLSTADKQQIYDDFTAIYEQEFLRSPQLFDGAYEFLVEFEGQIAIVSNKRERFIHPILKALSLDQFPFCRIIGGDTLHKMKPDPLPFLAAMGAAGATPEQTLVVGDGIPDVVGALAVGSRCVVVEFGYHPYGELMALGADATLDTYQNLPAVIDALT